MRPSFLPRSFVVLSLLSLLAVPAASGLVAGTALAAQPVEITTCGQVLEGSGYLAADLDCSGDAVNLPTVTLGPRGTLELRGFTLTSRPSDGQHPTVSCGGRCTIQGPGTIQGSPEDHSTVVRTQQDLKYTTGISVENATISGGHHGLHAARIRLRNAVVTGARSMGIWSVVTTVADSDVIGNGDGTEPCLQRCIGIWADRKAKVFRSNVTGNGQSGIMATRTIVSDSVVSENSSHPICGGAICVDVAVVNRPMLRNSTCETSLTMGGPVQVGDPPTVDNDPATHNWGICDLD